MRLAPGDRQLQAGGDFFELSDVVAVERKALAPPTVRALALEFARQPHDVEAFDRRQRADAGDRRFNFRVELSQIDKLPDIDRVEEVLGAVDRIAALLRRGMPAPTRQPASTDDRKAIPEPRSAKGKSVLAAWGSSVG